MSVPTTIIKHITCGGCCLENLGSTSAVSIRLNGSTGWGLAAAAKSAALADVAEDDTDRGASAAQPEVAWQETRPMYPEADCKARPPSTKFLAVIAKPARDHPEAGGSRSGSFTRPVSARPDAVAIGTRAASYVRLRCLGGSGRLDTLQQTTQAQ